VSTELHGPDGSALAVRVVERDGADLLVETDAATWDHLHADGTFHTDRVELDRPFEPDRPVTIELALDPAADDETDADAWWARTATQLVDLPPDLAEDGGELREGVEFPPPPWEAGLHDAWRAVTAMSDEPLLDLVKSVFSEQGLEFERPSDDATIIQVPMDDDPDVWVRTDEEAEQVTVFTVLPVDIAEGMVPTALELAARFNGSVAVGGFEVNPDNGVFSFKVGIDVRGDRLSVPLIRQLVGHAILAGRASQPLVEAVVAGDLEPRRAAQRFKGE
jgi:hypothetical protein